MSEMVGGHIHQVTSDIDIIHGTQWALLESDSFVLPRLFIWNELNWFLKVIFFFLFFPFFLSFYREFQSCGYRHLRCTWWKLDYTNLVAVLQMLLLKSQDFSRNCSQKHLASNDAMILSWLDFSLIREDLKTQKTPKLNTRKSPASPKLHSTPKHLGVEWLKHHPLSTFPPPAGWQ